MGGGGINKAENDQKAITQSQVATGNQTLADSEARAARGDALTQPLVDFTKSVMSGDRTTRNQALAVPLADITKQNTQTKERIKDQVPAGAAQDVALAQTERDKGTQVAGLEAGTFMNAFPTLAGLAGQQYNLGTTDLGASISSTSNASQSNQSVLSVEEQKKSSLMQGLGGLAGAGGSFLGGAGFAKLIGGK
jgi:hypothetical protein